MHRTLSKNDLHDPDNHNGVITHLDPDILECEVKRALESITMNKASGGDGISAKLFKILKDDAVKVSENLENSTVAMGLEKVSFHSNPKVRQCQRMLKLPHNCTHLSSVRFSRSVVSNSLRPHELQHARPPCPSPSPRVHSDSRPLSL